MVRAAFTQGNDVIDFHPRMGLAARRTDFGGTNLLHVVGADLPGRDLTNPPIMRSGIVNLFGAFWVLLSPFRLLQLKFNLVVLAVRGAANNYAV